MTQPDPALDPLLNTITGFLLPFFLVAAAGDPQAARTAITRLINAYNPGTTAELDLVGRIIGFSTVALDNLRLSMTEGLSDTKVLRYRSNAVSLSRAAEQARQILQSLQEQRETTQAVPRPTVAAAPTPAHVQPTSPKPQHPLPVAHGFTASPSMDIEAMKRDARVMMAAFSKHDSTSAIRMSPDPAAAVSPAARAAINAALRPPGA